jgi:hypothetical protein
MRLPRMHGVPDIHAGAKPGQPLRWHCRLEMGEDRLAVGLNPRRKPEGRGTEEIVLVDDAVIKGAAAEGHHEAREMAAIFGLGRIEGSHRLVLCEGCDERRDDRLAVDRARQLTGGQTGRHGTHSLSKATEQGHPVRAPSGRGS